MIHIGEEVVSMSVSCLIHILLLNFCKVTTYFRDEQIFQREKAENKQVGSRQDNAIGRRGKANANANINNVVLNNLAFNNNYTIFMHQIVRRMQHQPNNPSNESMLYNINTVYSITKTTQMKIKFSLYIVIFILINIFADTLERKSN